MQYEKLFNANRVRKSDVLINQNLKVRYKLQRTFFLQQFDIPPYIMYYILTCLLLKNIEMIKTIALKIISEDGDTVVIRDGIKVSFNARGGIDVYGGVPVTLHAPLNDTARPQPKPVLEVGDRIEDGTIYAGISPDTGKPLYTTPADAPLTMKWREATDYAAGLEAHGHNDWRLASKAELNLLFHNRVTTGRFDTSGSIHSGYYWSSSKYYSHYAWSQRFSDGNQFINFKDDMLSVRCVRS